MKPGVTSESGDARPGPDRTTGRDACPEATRATDRETPADSAGSDASVIISALGKLRDDYAAELRYRRLVAWIACLIVAVLLLGAVVGGYLYRDRVAALEGSVTAIQAVADERARTIQDLRAELAAAHRREADLRSKLALPRQTADPTEDKATAGESTPTPPARPAAAD